MTELSIAKQIQHLDFLTRSIRAAAFAIFGCFLTTVSIIIAVRLAKRVCGVEQLQNRFALDFIGILLASSAFIATVGISLALWLIIDAAAEYKRLNVLVKYRRMMMADDE